MANDYTTVAAVKALMPDTFASGTTKYDAAIGIMVTAASRMVDGQLKRDPGSFAVSEEETRYFQGNSIGSRNAGYIYGSGGVRLWIGELAGIPSYVGIAEAGVVDNASGAGGEYTEVETSDYMPFPANALVKQSPILALDLDTLNGNQSRWYTYPNSVKIVGLFGYTSTSNLPSEIVMATEIQAVRMFKRAQQAFQDASSVREISDIRYIRQIDPDVVLILGEDKYQWLSL